MHIMLAPYACVLIYQFHMIFFLNGNRSIITSVAKFILALLKRISKMLFLGMGEKVEYLGIFDFLKEFEPKSTG